MLAKDTANFLDAGALRNSALMQNDKKLISEHPGRKGEASVDT